MVFDRLMEIMVPLLSPAPLVNRVNGRGGQGLNKNAAGLPAAKRVRRVGAYERGLLRWTGAIRGGQAGDKTAHADVQNDVIAGGFVAHNDEIISLLPVFLLFRAAGLLSGPCREKGADLL